MKIKFIDLPLSSSIEEYEILIEKLIAIAKKNPNIIAVYQIGSILNPGISDIDLLFVFKDDYETHENYKIGFNKKENYLLAHNIFGTSESIFNDAQLFTFFHNYKIIYGKDLRSKILIRLNPQEIVFIKNQIALEYLIKMYITLSIQLKYKIIKIRSFLLEAKAVKYDLEFLNINNTPLNELVEYFIDKRFKWFSEEINFDEISDYIIKFNFELKKFLGEYDLKNDFYLPDEIINQSKNILIKRSNILSFNHRGIILPFPKSFKNRKYFNLLNKINQFICSVPSNMEIQEIIKKRFNYLDKAVSYNKKKLKNFAPLTTIINYYK